MYDPLLPLMQEMQRKEYLKDTNGRATKIINDFHKEMRSENLKTLAEITQEKLDSPLTQRKDKILLQAVLDNIEKGTLTK